MFGSHELPPSELPDVQETPAGVEMQIFLERPDLLLDPQSIVVVGLPRVWSLDELPERMRTLPKVIQLVESGTPFIPGIKPYGAWVHVFNPTTLESGSGTLVFDSLQARWAERATMPVRFTDPYAFAKAVAKRFGQEDTVDSGTITSEGATSMDQEGFDALTDEEIVEAVFREILIHLPESVFGQEFAKNPTVKKQIVRIILRLDEISQSPEESHEAEIARLYDDLREIISKAIPDSYIYRYGRRLLVSQVKHISADSKKATLVLV